MLAEGSSSPAGPDPASTRRLDRRIAAIAARRHGLITAEQLRGCGLSRSAIHDRVTAGRLYRHHRGVYSLVPSLPTLEARMLTAVLACGAGAVPPHRSALVLWGVCPGSPSAFEVTAPTRRGRGDPRIRAHRSADLAAGEVTLRRGIPVTGVDRSLIDFAAPAGLRELERAVDESGFLGLIRRSDLAARLRDRPPRRGCRRLRRALDPDRPPSRTRSGPEERLLVLVRRGGVEAPFVNRRIATPEGSFEVDFCWPGRRLIVETDGFAAHGGERRFHSDRERDQCLGAAGWRVYRFTPTQVFDRPDETIRRVAALLRGAPAPR